MKLLTVLAFAAVALGVLAVLAPAALYREFRRPPGETLWPWMGTGPDRRRRLVLVLALLFAVVGGLATLANLTGR